MNSVSCNKDAASFDNQVCAWAGIRAAENDSILENYFLKAGEAGVDAIFLECHGGYPAVPSDGSFRDSAAIDIMTRAAVFAKKYNVDLHAWMWTTNRAEITLREAHRDWYQVNALGESCADIKLYNREHYRFLCPNHTGVAEYLKARAHELAVIDGVKGVHMDFIRYPDAILPYALHESRGVVQDKVYPQWDFCYCDECRAKFKEIAGIDPLELEDPTANEQWMKFRWDSMAELASEVAAEIKSCGKVSSAAVFASPEESKKLVRQDWADFRNVDIIMPMIYNRSYGFPNSWIETATREGVEALKAASNPAMLRSGMMVGGRMPVDTVQFCIDKALEGGSNGFCIFSLDAFARAEGGWDKLKEIIRKYKNN